MGFWLLPMLFSSLLGVGLLVGTIGGESYDMNVFREAGGRMAAGDHDLYDWTRRPQTGPAPVYLYPPAFAAMYAPVALLPPLPSRIAWALFSIWFWFFALYRFGVALEIEKLASWGLACALVIITPMLADMWGGQVNLMLCALLLLALTGVTREKSVSAGSYIAVAASVKVLPGALLIPLIATRRYKAATAVLLGTLCLAVLPILWLSPHHGLLEAISMNWEMHVSYLKQLVLPTVGQQQAVSAHSESEFNVSLPHAFGIWVSVFGFSAGFGRLCGLLVGVALFLSAVLFVSKRTDYKQLMLSGFGLTYVAVTLMNVTTWLLHLTVLSICVAPVLFRLLRHTKLRRLLMIACGALFLMTYLPTWIYFDPRIDHLAIGWMSLSLGTLGLLIFWFSILFAIRALPPQEPSEE